MTRDDVKRLFAIIRMECKGFEVSTERIDFWFSCLVDLDAKIAEAALKKHFCSSPHDPKPYDIRKHAEELTTPQNSIEAIEAWGLVRKAIIRFGERRKKEAMDSLPSGIVPAVSAFGWQSLCCSENEDIVRANFLKYFESFQKSQRARAVLPPELQAYIHHALESGHSSTVKAIQAKREPEASQDAQRHKPRPRPDFLKSTQPAGDTARSKSTLQEQAAILRGEK